MLVTTIPINLFLKKTFFHDHATTAGQSYHQIWNMYYKKSKYLLCFFNFNRVSLFIVLVSGMITSKYSHTRFSLCFVSEVNMITDTVHFYSHLGVSSSHTTLSLYAYTAYLATFTPLQASVSYVPTCLSSRNTRWTCFWWKLLNVIQQFSNS